MDLARSANLYTAHQRPAGDIYAITPGRLLADGHYAGGERIQEVYTLYTGPVLPGFLLRASRTLHENGNRLTRGLDIQAANRTMTSCGSTRRSFRLDLRAEIPDGLEDGPDLGQWRDAESSIGVHDGELFLSGQQLPASAVAATTCHG